jgi:Fe-S cluster assembly iron-binding protein IscA
LGREITVGISSADARGERRTHMLTVTERAKETLARLKRQSQIEDDDVGLRLSLAASLEPGQGQFGLRADREALGDQVVEYEGTKVLLVEEELADALSDATIDAEPTERGDDLIIKTENDHEGGAR